MIEINSYRSSYQSTIIKQISTPILHMDLSKELLAWSIFKLLKLALFYE